jgi:hypothetical protein
MSMHQKSCIFLEFSGSEEKLNRKTKKRFGEGSKSKNENPREDNEEVLEQRTQLSAMLPFFKALTETGSRVDAYWEPGRAQRSSTRISERKATTTKLTEESNQNIGERKATIKLTTTS